MIATQSKTCVCSYYGQKPKKKEIDTDVSLVLNPKGSRSGWLRRLMNGAGWERQNRPAISRPKSSLRCKHAVRRKIHTSTDALPVPGKQTPSVNKRETLNPKPQTPNPKPQTPNPKPQTANLKPRTPSWSPACRSAGPSSPP